VWRLGFLLVTAASSPAADYLDESREFVGPPQSTTERFTFTLEKDGPYPHYDLAVKMKQGRADLRIFNPADQQLQAVGGQSYTVQGPIRNATRPGAYRVELTTTQAIGEWHLRIYGGPAPSKASVGPGVAAAGSMMLVAVASVWFWRRRTKVAWRWFWAGAAVWSVAVAAKVALAIPFHQPILDLLKASFPHWGYLTAGSLYGGLMTGITEVLFTFLAALIWRQMAATAARGVAIGVGAGAFEAALLVIPVAVQIFVKSADALTWSVALAPAVERLFAILCHVASRALVLLAVARRRLLLFWCGFLLLSAVDAVATLLHLTGQVGRLSPWVVEASFAPLGLLSIPITIWCIRQWPSTPSEVVPTAAASGSEATQPGEN